MGGDGHIGGTRRIVAKGGGSLPGRVIIEEIKCSMPRKCFYVGGGGGGDLLLMHFLNVHFTIVLFYKMLLLLLYHFLAVSAWPRNHLNRH